MTAVAAFVASRTGRAQDVFLPGILLNLALAVAFAVSMLTRWPVVGFLVGAVTEEPTAWRRDRGIVALCQKLTALLLAGYVLRVAVQLPLYLRTTRPGWPSPSSPLAGPCCCSAWRSPARCS